MRLGIISDSHGQIQPVRRALAELARRGANAFVHCGDVGGLDVLEELAGRDCRFVWGNVDYPQPHWRGQVEALGLPWPDGPLQLDLNGKHLAVYHGHERDFPAAIRAARYDYLLCGHTHRPEDYRVGPMRVINPGALSRTRAKSAALLDLETDHLELIPIEEDR